MVQSISMLMSALFQSIAALKNITPHMSAFNDFTHNFFFAEDKFDSMKECFKFVCLLKRKLRSESATEMTAQRIITKNVIALKAIQALNMTVAKCDLKNDCLEAPKITA